MQVTGSARDEAGAVTRVTYAVGPGAEREVSITRGREVSFAFTARRLAEAGNTITVHAEDERGNRGTQTVTVTYRPNRPPVARDDTASTWSDTAVVVPALANDADPDGDSLRVRIVAPPILGTATVLVDGTIRYAPHPGRSGMDSFRYAAVDTRGASHTATVVVTLRPLPGPYAVTVVPPIEAASTTTVLDLNDLGQVLLQGSMPGGEAWVSVLWENGRSTVIGRLPFTGTGASVGARALTHALNDHDEQLYSYCTAVAGTTFKTCTQYGFTLTGTPPQVAEGYRTASPQSVRGRLNQSDCVILGGEVWLGGWRVPRDLGSYGTWEAVALSSRRDVVGTTTRAGVPSALLMENGSTRTILITAGDSTFGRDVNDALQVVGVARNAGGPRFAFFWSGGTVRRLATEGATGVASIHLNDRGDVVYVAESPRTAYVWRAGRAFRLGPLLRDPGWEITGVAEFNDRGQVAAYARNTGTGASSILLLTPER